MNRHYPGSHHKSSLPIGFFFALLIGRALAYGDFVEGAPPESISRAILSRYSQVRYGGPAPRNSQVEDLNAGLVGASGDWIAAPAPAGCDSSTFTPQP
jgi:hypothetical protein